MPTKKKPHQYHHGDLPRAMVREAVRIIQQQGVASLTLRGVGERLGVSRTALYRHFTDKQALLVAVAGEGFRTLRTELAEAYEQAGRGQSGFNEMGLAYVRFALKYPSHYRVMFGGFVTASDLPTASEHGADAFQVLVDAIVEQQHQGVVRDDEPRRLALYIWSVVHGVAMLALDGMLNKSPIDAEALMRYANGLIREGIVPSKA